MSEPNWEERAVQQAAEIDLLRWHTAGFRNPGVVKEKIIGSLAAFAAAAYAEGQRSRDAVPAFACDYQRMWDLVRVQRGELLDAELITREEYMSLLQDETKNGPPGQGSPSPRRLESYDEVRAHVATLTRERDEARDFGVKASEQYNALLKTSCDVTCAFCGATYPRGTPRYGDGALADHIKTCPQHPMRAVERDLSEARAELAALKGAQKHEQEQVYLEWSDRAGRWHPSEFFMAVRACALDHYYDRTPDGVPHGMPEEYRKAFAPVVARHLSAVEPRWENVTVFMSDEQETAFEADLLAAQQQVESGAFAPREQEQQP